MPRRASSSDTPTATSTTRMITSASAIGPLRLPAHLPRSRSPPPASHPPVSTTRNVRPAHSATSSLRSRVTPGCSSTIACATADEPVHERRLADVRPADDRRPPARCRSSQCSDERRAVGRRPPRPGGAGPRPSSRRGSGRRTARRRAPGTDRRRLRRERPRRRRAPSAGRSPRCCRRRSGSPTGTSRTASPRPRYEQRQQRLEHLLAVLTGDDRDARAPVRPSEHAGATRRPPAARGTRRPAPRRPRRRTPPVGPMPAAGAPASAARTSASKARAMPMPFSCCANPSYSAESGNGRPASR